MIACSERRIVQDYESSFGGRKYWSVAWRWERVFDYPKRLMAYAELCTPIVRHSVGEIKSESMYQAIWSHP